MKRIGDLVKEGKLKEITDFRDEIDLSGFKLTLDLRRGTDPDKLMAKLYKLTPLEDDFSCNFNILIDGTPRQLGVVGMLKEWISFRMECVRRELSFDLSKKQEKLHLLLGLGKILLDIDKAIRIVRETEVEADVVPNLMEGFGIDEVQAEYIAEIKLRYLNREYIINRIKEIEDLQKEIADLKTKIGDDVKVREHIAAELRDIKKKYAKPRQTQLIYPEDISLPEPEDEEESYPVRVYVTRDGYFKKITLQSLRGNDEQKLKDGDEVVFETETDNRSELLFFGSKAQCYKARLAEIEPVKASQLGDYIPAKLGFDDGETLCGFAVVDEYRDSDNMIFIFENGKGVRVPLTAYQTKTNRHKLTAAFSDASPVVAVIHEREPMKLLLQNSQHKAIIISSELISQKTTRSSAGVQLMNLKGAQKLVAVTRDFEGKIANPKKYENTKLPATPVLLDEYDLEKQQLTFE